MGLLEKSFLIFYLEDKKINYINIIVLIFLG